jgi:capsular polysaccharide transport system permease protein
MNTSITSFPVDSSFQNKEQPTVNMSNALKIQIRVLIALIFREAAARFGSGLGSYLWTLAEPALMLCVLLIGRIYIKQYTAAFGDSSAVFLLTGYMTFRMTKNTITKSGRVLGASQTLLTFAPVKPIDVILARTILECTIWVVMILLFFSATGYLIGQAVIVNYQLFTQAMILTFYFIISMTLLSTILTVLVPFWSTILKMSNLPLLVTSGVLLVPSQMPPNIIAIMTWNPILHCIEGVRTSSYIDYLSLYDPIYLLTFSTVTLILAMALERIFRKRLLNTNGVDDEMEEDEL